MSVIPEEWKECRCGAYLPIREDRTFPRHNEGDAPDWWNVQLCALSEKPVRRRPPGKVIWWQKYVDTSKKR